MAQESLHIPKQLTELMQLTVKLLTSSKQDLLEGGDDAIQTEEAYGGPVDEHGKLFRFTYHAKDAGERWDVIVTSDQVESIAKEEMKTLPILPERPAWADTDLPSGVFVETEEARWAFGRTSG